MNLSSKQIKNIKKHLLGKATVKSITRPNKSKKEFQKTNCFHCDEVIDKRKRDFIQVVKRCELAFADCPNICFHSTCWVEAAGEDFEIK